MNSLILILSEGLKYLLILCTVVWGAGVTVLWLFLRKKPVSGSSSFSPKVSILKIFCGIDEGLAENLESFCQIDYPDYEIILSVLDPQDPVIPLLEQFAQRHPEKAVSLVINPFRIGYNLQVCNFHNALQKASGQIVIFSDSDTRATRDYITRLIEPLSDPKVGVVSGLPFIVNPVGMAGHFKAIACNITVPGMDVFWRHLAPIAIGPAMAARKDILEKIGGLRPIANKLTTDQELGKLVHAHGYKTRLVPYLVRVYEKKGAFLSHLQQILRWLIAVRVSNPADYNFIPLAMPTFLALLYWLTAPLHAGPITALTLTLLWRGLLPIWIYRVLYRHPLQKKHSWTFAFADLLFPLLWIRGFFVRQIEWRDSKFLLVGDELIPSQNPTAPLPEGTLPLP